MSEKSWKEVQPGILFRASDGVVEIEVHGAKHLEVGRSKTGIDIVINQKQLVVLSVVGSDLGVEELYCDVQDLITSTRNKR